MRYLEPVLTMLAALAFAGCATVPGPAAPGSGPRAVALLRQAADVSGNAPFPDHRDISIHLDGHWSPIIGKLQPTLVDDRFRGISEERYLLSPSITAQFYHGPGGTKYVYRDSAAGVTHVWYNGRPSGDADVLASAALVADGYRMFLLGPAFFLERHAAVRYLHCETINGNNCDDVLATLRPGIGGSAEDRVVISIDRRSHRISRYRMTVNGLANVKGGVADIFCHDYLQVSGISIPTRFYEELKNPLDLSVHHWQLTGIDLNRGLTAAALAGPQFTGVAARPAGSIQR